MTATSSFRLDGGEPFSCRDGVVHVGGLPVDQLAGAAGTPVYLYDLDEVAVAYRRGDLVAVLDTGAYGMVMASEYNGQPRPAEVVVAGSEALLSRQRETWGDLLAWESHLGPPPPDRCPPAHQPAGSPEAEGLIVSSRPPTLPSPRAAPPRAVARGHLRGASERLG